MKRQIHTRQIEPTDYPFLFSTYLKHNWYDKTQSTTLKKATWMSLQHKRLEKVFKEKPVAIACDPEEPDYIFAYAFEDGDKTFFYFRLNARPEAEKISKLLTIELEKNHE